MANENFVFKFDHAELFNATGNLVDRIDGAQGSVSFQPAAQGLYLIRVTSGGTVKTFKVVK
ncbi:MAG TPA: T9SS type A sorting domain-containing protein [Candidatus Barnesiella merdigallinarum]|nr:T9SS type A sorting domain-containing protein [Candidatus Barnesiella merdigallinarum]